MTTQIHIVQRLAQKRRPPFPPLRPIRNEAELDTATRLAERLAEAEERGALSADAADYLEVLLLLIERYEDERHPIRALPTARERLSALVQAAGMSASDLGRLLGNRALGSKLLTGEREPSKLHIRRLADHFKLDPGFFL
jgi:HTH-type transcriptional regulator/antitoxin HigA